MNYSKVLFFLLFVAGVYTAQAQNGSLSGMITDGETGEELIGATVYIPSIAKGAVTDIYGNYSIKGIPAGTYKVEVSYVTYQKNTIEGVEIKDGQNTEISVALSTAEQQLDEVVVVAKQIKNNEVALLSMQRKAVGVQDGISSQEIKNLGASNAAESMKQVTGASIEDGKYVVMRGLGDRYSISLLNGIPLPSADPYRNSTSMDMIPADMVMNIVTQKTFTPDMPGNFTGGAVDITTKSMPEEFYFNAGMSFGYNTQSSFRDDFITDSNSGGMDWLGYDDGTRDRPTVFDANKQYLQGSAANQTAIIGRVPENDFERNLIDESSKAFNSSFLERRKSSAMNYGLNIAFGNQHQYGDKKLGYNVGLLYDRSYEMVPSGMEGYYSRSLSGTSDLVREQEFTTMSGSEKATVGGLFGLSYQFSPTNEINFDAIYNHSGESYAQVNDGYWRNTAYPNFNTRVNGFKERELVDLQLRGKHYFMNLNELKIDWSAGRVNVSQDEPDMKLFAYNTTTSNGQTDYIMNQSEVGILPTHLYRYLNDVQYNAKLDISFKLLKDAEHTLKFGGWYSTKERDYEEFFYSQVQVPVNQYNPSYVTFSEAAGDFDRFFSDANSGIVDTPTSNGTGRYGFGNFYQDLSRLQNFYSGNETIIAGYAMADFRVTDKFQVVAGGRVETTDIETLSLDKNAAPGIIDQVDFLPSVNTKYAITENANLRLAYSQTLARPNLREIAPIFSISMVGRPNFLGNPDLLRTKIQNFDLRYELFPKAGELIAFSAYYKSFNDPIVLQLTPKASSPEIRPINVGTATVYGAEVEFRKRLDFLGETFQNFKLSANFSYIYSRIDKSDEEIAAFRAQGLDLDEWRPLPGQSPYIVNVALNHYSPKLDWDNTLSFNIWGERLSYVTGAIDPDVYEQPRPSLNFVSRKSVGEHWSVSFKAMNILNMTYEKKFQDTEYDYETYQVGTDINVGVSYKF
ncbi:TonB-dependent receptor [Marinigracilibium pacificum]|uniref:TonB-dependent receptor n=1 Tax=Marinigracilibium pacificum TaxID=2729599 RepID=A0A848IVB2_9BACT|nr:TonB-dependent receptor [Marinigracilibium pacificum]NMM47128.1 TonB-dependent receptor [Marinigracilibium pacificum]